MVNLKVPTFLPHNLESTYRTMGAFLFYALCLNLSKTEKTDVRQFK